MSDRVTPEPDAAAIETYEVAYQRVCLARRAWFEAGEPITMILPNGIETTHPRWKTLHEAESWFEKTRLQVYVLPKHRGPKPTAVISKTIGPSPASHLRAVPEKDV